MWSCGCGFTGNLPYDATCRSCGAERGDARALYHRTDPDTSRDAAESTVAMRARHLLMVSAELRKGPLAAEQIAAATGLDTLQVMKRISDLRRTGRAVETTRHYTNRSSGRKATVWMLAA